MISVVVPVYKTEKYLPQCIESILAQSFEDFELLLVDDGSPDGSGAICDGYAARDGRIRVFHTENHGVSEARNTGIKESVGEYIAFCDSDDRVGRDWLRHMYGAAVASGAGICSGGMILEYTDRLAEIKGREGVFSANDAVRELLAEKFSVNVWNKLFRKDLFDNVEFPPGRSSEDVITTALLFEAADSVIGIPAADYFYRQRKNSSVSIYGMKQLADYWEVHLERFRRFSVIPEIGGDPETYDRLLMFCGGAASKLWRWAWGTGDNGKNELLANARKFVREMIPRKRAKGWPAHIRLTLPLIRLGGKASLYTAFLMNRLLRKCVRNNNELFD